MAEIYQIPESGANTGGIPFSIPIGGNGMFGNGQTNLMDLLGFAIVASIFPNFFGGAGGRGNMPNVNADLAMQAIVSQGEASRTAIQTLASSIGQDFNIVYGTIGNIQNALSQIGATQGMNALQVINAIQNGNAGLASQLSQCCCNNQLAMCQQTNTLQSQADRNHNALLNAINQQTIAMNDQFCALKEREMQQKIDTQADIITQLRGQQDNANQTNQIMAYVNAVLSPLQAKVDQIAAKQLPTVNVQYPQLTAVNTSPYTGGGMYGSATPTFNF